MSAIQPSSGPVTAYAKPTPMSSIMASIGERYMSRSKIRTMNTVAKRSEVSAPLNNSVASTEIPAGPLTRTLRADVSSIATLKGSAPEACCTIVLISSMFSFRTSVSEFSSKEIG